MITVLYCMRVTCLKGRGMSPHIWQILEGATSFPVTLLDCADPFDTSAVWNQKWMEFDGTELFDEIDAKIFDAELELMSWAIKNCANTQPREQSGEATIYPRRTASDSRNRTVFTTGRSVRYTPCCQSRSLSGIFRIPRMPIQTSLGKVCTMTSIEIADRKIGANHRPYLIAEMSGNHNHSLDRALEIVDAAAASGADAMKLQTYTAETMTLNIDTPDFIINDSKSLWNGRQLYDLYSEAHTPWEWHQPIMERAASYGMHCFSTPFDDTAVDFLMELSVPAFKIASFECTDLPLIRKVAATGKPMIISTGMATVAEIDEAVRAAKGAGAKDIILLKCTSTYPATPENTNVLTIPHLREMFGCEVGLSDHTMGCGAAIAAVVHGACVLEKHFTLARAGRWRGFDLLLGT